MDIGKQEQKSQNVSEVKLKGPGIRDAYRKFTGDTINRYVKKEYSSFLPRDEKGRLQVLSVGCQFGYEAQPVIELFGDSNYTGVDIEPVWGAVRTNDDLPTDRVTFRTEDAREVLEEEKGKYGLVIMRQPTIESFDQKLNHFRGALKSNDPFIPEMTPEWREIFDSTMAKVTLNGLILVTTKVAGEEEAVRKYFQERNERFEVLTDEDNKEINIHSPRNDDIHVFVVKNI